MRVRARKELGRKRAIAGCVIILRIVGYFM